MSTLPAVFLNVSDLYITNQNKSIKTILGSCVSVTMHVPRLQLSAICHARLPSGKRDLNSNNSFCYVDDSILYMINALTKRGGNKSEFIVKAFGGANVLFVGDKKGQVKKTIGEQNIEMVKTILNQAGLSLTSYDLGGDRGRKLIYNTYKNEVLIKMLKEDILIEDIAASLV